MLRRVILPMLLLLASPSFAGAQEIEPVAADALIGHAYSGVSTPSVILFISVHSRPVRVLWISFDGTERPYRVLTQGEQMFQPTFVAHRWIVRDAEDGTPLEAFISTRSAARSNGTPQIALIR